MAFGPHSRPQEPQPPGTPRAVPPGSVLISKMRRDELYNPDKELLDSGYMSDCTVICRDVKWSTHKVILCNRNKWFRIALDGPFKEASTAVVTIEDTDSDAVQVVLRYIYTGQINYYCSTPAMIVEIWKAGDFFGIRELIVEAEKALSHRLYASLDFFRFNPEPKREIQENTCCFLIKYKYGLCDHVVEAYRRCGVNRVKPQDEFHLCEPVLVGYDRDSMCFECRHGHMRGRGGSSPSAPPERLGQDAEHGASSVRSPPHDATVRSTPPDDETRAMIEDEIRALCEALLIATIGTPQGSRMQELLIHHMCKTRVKSWDGFTVCRFLEPTRGKWMRYH